MMLKRHIAVLGVVLCAAQCGSMIYAAVPTVSVVASVPTATIGTTNPGAFTFTRDSGTTTNRAVNFSLGGSAVKWTDYRRLPEGDMPVSFAIPAGAASATMTI